MIQERDIRDKITALLARQVSLSVFEQWLGSESWNMFNDSPNAVHLVAAVNMLVSELHDDVISSEQFRSELADLLNNIDVSEPIDNPAPSLDVRFSRWQDRWVVLSPDHVAA